MTGKQKRDDLDSLRTVLDALDGLEAGEQERILRWAREKLGLGPGAPAGATAPAEMYPAVETADAMLGSGSTDIKTFVESKKPASDTQFAATVAYYYRFSAPAQMRKDSIKAEDLQDACRRVNRPRLKFPAQTLVNAHGQGLLDRAEPGSYSINTVGENLVAVALPSDGNVRLGRSRAKKTTTARKGAAKKTGARGKRSGARRHAS